MAIANIDTLTETVIPPELEGKPICVKPGIVQYEDFLASVCLSLNMNESIKPKVLEADQFHFTVVKPYSIQVKLSDMDSKAIELFIAKTAYTVRHSEKKAALKSGLFKQIISVAILAGLTIASVAIGRGGTKLAYLATAWTGFSIIAASILAMKTLYALATFNRKIDQESIEFCAKTLGKEKSLLALDELFEKKISFPHSSLSLDQYKQIIEELEIQE